MSSVIPAPSNTSSVLPTTMVSIYQPSIHAPSPSDGLILANSSNSSSINISTTDEMSNRISTTMIDWLKKKQQELNLTNTNFQQGIDFHVELNKRRDELILRCKSVAQKVLLLKNEEFLW